MKQDITSNTRVTFLFAKIRKIDLEALNLLAGNTESILCSCSYCEEDGKHRVDYDVLNRESLFDRSIFSVEDFAASCIELFDVIDKYNLNLANVKMETQYIFVSQRCYQFVYIPIQRKKQISNKKFLIKILTKFKKRNTGEIGRAHV